MLIIAGGILLAFFAICLMRMLPTLLLILFAVWLVGHYSPAHSQTTCKEQMMIEGMNEQSVKNVRLCYARNQWYETIENLGFERVTGNITEEHLLKMLQIAGKQLRINGETYEEANDLVTSASLHGQLRAKQSKTFELTPERAEKIRKIRKYESYYWQRDPIEINTK